jgi:hypothetical protein
MPHPEEQMPADFRIEREHRLVRSRAWGILTDAQTRAHYEDIAHDPAFERGFSLLCDLRAVTHIEAGPHTLRDLARFSTFARGTHRAFVVIQDEHFGLARMFQAFCELEGAHVGVFRSLAEAHEWLGLPPPRPEK